MVGYTRQSAGTILTGNTIQASDFNAEYNLLESAFGAVSGHNHDGTIGGGAKIPVAGLSGLTNTSAGIMVADGANGYVLRTLTAPAAGITITNGTGVSGNPTLVLANDLAGLEGLATNGVAVRTGTSTWTTRTITAGANISVSNGDGVSGNPTIALTGIGSTIQAYDTTLVALAAYNTNGILTQTAADTFTGRTITGTAGTITVTNGNGVSGNPTLTIDSSYIGQNTITTLGTITTGVWSGTTIGISKGGTGQTTANAAFNALAPSQVANSGKFLTTDGTDTSWATISIPVPNDVPTGFVGDFAGSSAPTGWLMCYGQAVSRTTYSDLFTVISTTYGVGDGSTTFNLPDCRGRTTAGKDNMGGTSANRLTGLSGGIDGDILGQTGGAESHTLTTAQIESHTHTATVTDPGHRHRVLSGNPSTISDFGTLSTSQGVAGASNAQNGYTTNNGSAVAIIENSTTGVTVSNSATGGGGAHNNVQPTIIFNKIIKT